MFVLKEISIEKSHLNKKKSNSIIAVDAYKKLPKTVFRKGDNQNESAGVNYIVLGIFQTVFTPFVCFTFRPSLMPVN
jgi:hypothetical protein